MRRNYVDNLACGCIAEKLYGFICAANGARMSCWSGLDEKNKETERPKIRILASMIETKKQNNPHLFREKEYEKHSLSEVKKKRTKENAPRMRRRQWGPGLNPLCTSLFDAIAYLRLFDGLIEM